MRLRLVHQLFLLLALSSTVVVVTVSVLIAQVLSAGFGRVMHQIEEDRVEALARLAQVRYEREGNFDSMVLAWRRLFELADDAARRDGGTRDAPSPVAGLSMLRQILIEDAEGRVIAGPTDFDPVRTPLLRRDVIVAGRRVGSVAVTRLPRDVSSLFPEVVHRQRLAIAGSAAVTLLVALLASAWLARRLAARLLAVTSSTERIARGELDVQVPDVGGDEIGSLAANVNRMADSLRAAESSRQRWLANIAHELRNPLAALAAEIEALQDGVRPVTARALASLREEVTHLARLTNDLHQITLAQLGQLSLQLEPLDAAALVERCAARWDEACRRAGLSLRTGISSAPSLADELRVTQILDNLLSNSLRYTDAPGTIELRCEAHAHGARLVVEDSAPGVPRELLGHLFQPLFRADAARSRATGGSGLGLAMVRALATAMGGHCTALQSHLGGVRVEVWLPGPREAA